MYVVALEQDETTYLVRQRRPNARQVGSMVVPKTLELPGGFADPDIPLAESAARKLGEETKRQAAQMRHVGTLYPSVGVSNEQDLDIVSGKFGDLYGRMLSDRMPVAAQTLAAMAKVAILL